MVRNKAGSVEFPGNVKNVEYANLKIWALRGVTWSLKDIDGGQ
jgi:hypothetical protein